MKIEVDEILCAGHAVCEEVAPDLFRVDENGLARVLVDEVPAEAVERAQTAVMRCPADAIRLVD